MQANITGLTAVAVMASLQASTEERRGYVYAYVCVDVSHMCVSAHGSQKWAPDPRTGVTGNYESSDAGTGN